jgi:uncharacterized membrane protein
MEEKPYETVNTPPAQIPPPTYQQAPTPVVVTTGGLSDNAAGALAYLTIIPAIIFLVVEPYNKSPFVRFHAWQSIGLGVAWFALNIIVSFIPFVRFFLLPLVGLGMFIIWIITLLKASRGEWFKLPVIGDFAMGQSKS